MRNKFFKQNGSIVLITILILTTVIGMVLISSLLVARGLKANQNQEFSTTAYFAAESGAERAIWENRKNGFDFYDCTQSGQCVQFSTSSLSNATCVPCSSATDYPLQNATYDVAYSTSSSAYILTSLGTYMGVTRSVQLTISY